MNRTKIRLSPSELELACNAAIILTKNTVLAKTKALLEDAQIDMYDYVTANKLSSHEAFQPHPKISKGENYLGLPYLVLDYPRTFKQEDVFAIRTMFWWGHFFSCTVQLSGTFKTEYVTTIEKHYPLLKEKNFFIGVNEDVWQHHFAAENYIPVKDLTEIEFGNFLQKHPHIKIAAKWPVDQWHFAANELFECWKFYLRMLALSS